MPTLAPGQRITLRSEDFLVTRAHTPTAAAYLVECEGISELVRGQHFTFDLRIDDDYAVVRPEDTTLVADTSNDYQLSRLYLESKLRAAEVSGHRIAVGHRAAINAADYQLKPALLALKQPFARILIADAVGLGKTIEVGILLAELMKRGRARRILVLALKSILAQFQQELWDRFAIPLMRLDSAGVAQLRTELPVNKNPFDYYDKSIISIDTLKNNAKFRHYLDQTHWDVIVIDECHNVANADSLRGGLATLLATRCDNLILTSATPHNGKAENFANLMRLLDPMIVPVTGADDLTGEHIEDVVVRRTKKNLPDEVSGNFSEREVLPERAVLYPAEEAWLAWQQNLKQAELAARAAMGGKGRFDGLFGITLFKAYLSSPAAAKESLENRIAKNEAALAETTGAASEQVLPHSTSSGQAPPLRSEGQNETTTDADRLQSEIDTLRYGLTLLEDVLKLGGQDASTPSDAKLEAFFALLDGLGWRGKPKDERIVVFAERTATLAYLEEQVSRRYPLKPYKADKEARVPKRAYASVAGFSGSLSDTEQTALIEDFGSGDSPIRLLLCSDAGSQGVNLHYHCHRMVNYDLPWSIITLDQRNGRIDRYGQERTPFIHYVLAESANQAVQTDLRIVEKIKEKEEEVAKTLGDASSVTQLFSADKEVANTARAIALGADTPFGEQAETPLDPLTAFMQGEEPATDGGDDGLDYKPLAPLSLYGAEGGTGAFYRELLGYLQAERPLDAMEVDVTNDELIEVYGDRDLGELLYALPKEAKPRAKKGYNFKLSPDPATVQRGIAEARKHSGTWAEFQLLYEAHPLAHYWLTKMQTQVGKGEAPVAQLDNLQRDTATYFFYGQTTNALGQSVLSDFIAVTLRSGGEALSAGPLADFLKDNQLPPKPPVRTTSDGVLRKLEGLIKEAVDWGKIFYLDSRRDALTSAMERRQAEHTRQLEAWATPAGFDIASAPAPREGERPSPAYRLRQHYERGKRKYAGFTDVQAESHLQLLGVWHNLPSMA